MVTPLLIIVLLLAVLVLVGFMLGYNKIRSADIRVAEALSGIDVELTRRASLIPSLVHTVQTFAAHEKGILDHVTDARAALTTATSGKSVAAAQRSREGARLGAGAGAGAAGELPAAELVEQLPEPAGQSGGHREQARLRPPVLQRCGRHPQPADEHHAVDVRRTVERCVRTRVLPDHRGEHADRLRRHSRARPSVTASAHRLCRVTTWWRCSPGPMPPPAVEPSRRRRRSRSWRSNTASRCCGRTGPTPTNSSPSCAELAPDCCAVVAYGALLRDGLLAVPPHGWINLHFSLLPAWRGAAPVQAAIAAGDAVTGATTFLIEPESGLRTRLRRRHRDGPARPTPRATSSTGCRCRAPRCWRRRLTASPTVRCRAVPQPADGVTVAPKITVDEARVRWDLPAHVVERRIRAVTPNPGAWTSSATCGSSSDR